MSDRISLQVLGSAEEILARRSEWDDCVLAAGGDIYFTCDWLIAWWQVYGKGRDLVAIIVRSERSGGAIAALAFAVDRIGPRYRPIRFARLAGTDPNYAVMGLPVLPENATEVWSVVLAHLLENVHCTFVSLSPLSDARDLRSTLLAGAVSASLHIARDVSQRNHTILDLPSDGNLYAVLSKGRQKEYRRSLNQMERFYNIERRLSVPDSVLGDFEAFVALHTRQWHARGKGGHFSDWPGSADFFRKILPTLAQQGRGFVEQLTGDNSLLASRLTFQLGDQVYWRLTGRDLDPKAQSIGVARVAILDWAAAAASRGGRIIEAGAGDYEYKRSYGGRSVPMRSIIFSSKQSRFSTALALMLFDLLDFAYYRVWFLRLAPRVRRWFGLRPQPLWQLWIRTRV